MVAITGNVNLSLLGKDSFQEVDIAGITMPITKHNFIIRDVNELAPVFRRAFKIAQEGRPGPVLIDIPKDITAQIAEYVYHEPEQIIKSKNRVNNRDIQDALALLETCQRPLICAGEVQIPMVQQKNF